MSNEMSNEINILQRSDCFVCGAEATYEKDSEDHYEVNCVNIDCPVADVMIVTSAEIEKGEI